MKSIKRKYYNSNPPTSTEPLVFAHISDVHANSSHGADQYKRFLEFVNHWKEKGYIDEIINTGDVVPNYYSDTLDWRNNLPSIENVMFVIGNHDTYDTTPSGITTMQKWQYHSAISVEVANRQDAYNKYLVGPNNSTPYINNWGVTQPGDAAENGFCYYYKDYNDRKLRMIAIDVMGYDNNQDLWLQERLVEAITLDYHVFIITHFCGDIMTGLSCNYTSLFSSGNDRSSLDGYNDYAYHIPISVDSFQSNGGNFVGYFMGHYHRDMVNILTNYPKQLAFAVSSGGVITIRDYTKTAGCKNYDDFQICSIDTYNKTVRLIKVGADIDWYMRKKGIISISYEIISEDNNEKVKGVIGEGW
jgi:hypothetical protein